MPLEQLHYEAITYLIINKYENAGKGSESERAMANTFSISNYYDCLPDI